MNLIRVVICFIFFLLDLGAWNDSIPLPLGSNHMFNFKQNYPYSDMVVVPPPSIKSNKNASAFEIIPQVLPNLEFIPDYIEQRVPKLEFLISYKALAKNGVIVGEKYNISEPIVKKGEHLKIEYICKIDSPANDIVTDDEAYAIKYILYYYQDEVLKCLRKSSVNIRYDGLSIDFSVQDQALLSLSAKRILAYFDNRYLILEVLKDKR